MNATAAFTLAGVALVLGACALIVYWPGRR